MNFYQHILERCKGSEINIVMDYHTQTVVFPLWNLSGILVGFQNYKWGADKKKHNNKEGRYWTFLTKGKLGVYGLDSYKKDEDLYIVEGIWDCIAVQATGRCCIAVLSNNPKHLKSWLDTLPNKIISVCDGDKAGKLLAKYGDKYIILPQGQDAGDLTIDQLTRELNESKKS